MDFIIILLNVLLYLDLLNLSFEYKGTTSLQGASQPLLLIWERFCLSKDVCPELNRQCRKWVLRSSAPALSYEIWPHFLVIFIPHGWISYRKSSQDSKFILFIKVASFLGGVSMSGCKETFRNWLFSVFYIAFDVVLVQENVCIFFISNGG